MSLKGPLEHTARTQTGISLSGSARTILDAVAAVGETVGAVKRPEIHSGNGLRAIVLVLVGAVFALRTMTAREKLDDDMELPAGITVDCKQSYRMREWFEYIWGFGSYDSILKFCGY